MLFRHEISIYYQPQFNAQSRTIIGFEALLRWNHPSKGYRSPVDFIPVAEECSLISEIGEWTLRKACKQMKQWHDQWGIHTSVAVILSTLHELKQIGVKISMDDFGTGYSSLYYLKLFPIERLKIDRSFIREVNSNE